MSKKPKKEAGYRPSSLPAGIVSDYERVKSEEDLKRDAELAMMLSARVLGIDPERPYDQMREMITSYRTLEAIESRGYDRGTDYAFRSDRIQDRPDLYHAKVEKSKAFKETEVGLGTGIGKIVYNRRGRGADKAGGKEK